MLLQTLVSIGLIAVVTAALLTRAVVDVANASRQLAARAASTGLAHGTAAFARFAQGYVAANGAAATWPTTPHPEKSEPVCTTCAASLTVSFRVASSSAAGSPSDPAIASGMQSALDENRISGVVTAVVTDAAGAAIASTSRLVTFRVFDAAPFAVLSGARDVTTMAGAAGATEGDTAGTQPATAASAEPTPDARVPAADIDTSIHVTMTCANSRANANQSAPFSDDNAPGNDRTQWGRSGGTGFEAPCTPAYAFTSVPNVPADARPNAGNVYDVSSFVAKRWSSDPLHDSSWAP